jgi:hypothetical protein
MQVMTFYELFGHKTAMPSTAPAKARAKPASISLRIGITFFYQKNLKSSSQRKLGSSVFRSAPPNSEKTNPT